MVDAAPQPPKNVQPPAFVPVNGSSIPHHHHHQHHKPEPPNHKPGLDLLNSRLKHTLPQPIFMQHAQVRRTPSQPQSPPVLQPPQQQWPLSLPFLATPQPLSTGPSAGFNPASSPIYPTFSHSPAGALSTLVSPIPSIPTSLASLLNDSGSLYVSYSTPSQAPNGLGEAGSGDPLMNYSPGHYFEGPSPMGWPLICMPPGQQS